MSHALQFKALKYKILWFQLLVVLVLAAIGWLYQGLYASLSVGLGGLIGILPGFVFASFYPSYPIKIQDRARYIVKRLYWAETVKLLVTVVLFILSFQWHDLLASYLFISFIILQFISVIVSLVPVSERCLHDMGV